MAGKSLERYAWLSVATGVVVLALKTLAWQLTDSVGLPRLRPSASRPDFRQMASSPTSK